MRSRVSQSECPPRFALLVAAGLCVASSTSVAQSTVKGTDVRVSSANGQVTGRGASGPASLFVGHRVDYCLTGGSPKSTSAFRVRFASKLLTSEILARESVVRGSLTVMQEPMDGRSERCSKIEFDVHADAVTALKIFSDSSDPSVVVESTDGGTRIGSLRVSNARVAPK